MKFVAKKIEFLPIPVSPLSVKRCGKCGCAEGKGAHGSGHATGCVHYDHRRVNIVSK